MTDAAPARRPQRPAEDPASPFYRAGGRNRFTAREAVVTAVSRPVDEFVRVTLSGPDFHDFTSSGPSDHVRVFLPDPVSGELVAPTAVGRDEDGIVRPDRPVISRDFTPLHPREDSSGARFVDIDLLLHADPGPAAAWAERAQVGDRLVVVGPRGSKAAPQAAPRVLCVVDGTALPAAGRFLAEVPAETEVEIIADIAGDLEWVRAYLAQEGGRTASVTAAGDDLVAAVQEAGIDAGTYLFAAAEAGRLVPLRRYLRRELALPRAQYALSGYWKAGLAGFDHHAPIDPDDPED
ncbi:MULTISPECIES: siderophore-interacting protein [Microbacterium]|uniref:NADPH-dependent ferric siderophore reductase, contains FAD-binding and SIP domains n=1 Tax=Microbacterium saccharophilum TaxID=1213358 RepID=A0A7Z7GEI1_9MICO|nr:MULTISPECIES: siderophore-interacting protein [Microbacterium]SFI74484.1 NADPH-dependent ferric siderophore reductase, contains FAD-binding and SIP domains [Microbacterium saccharophilum]